MATRVLKGLFAVLLGPVAGSYDTASFVAAPSQTVRRDLVMLQRRVFLDGEPAWTVGDDARKRAAAA